MTLGQFATAVGADPRWVQNARAVLKLRGRYEEDAARRLGLARLITQTTGMPLVRSYRLAGKALSEPPSRAEWVESSADGAVRVVIELDRYRAAFATRLSLARTVYAERPRGPRPARTRDAMVAARRQGVDVTLFDESLRLTPAERLRRLDEMSEFFRTARVRARVRR